MYGDIDTGNVWPFTFHRWKRAERHLPNDLDSLHQSLDLSEAITALLDAELVAVAALGGEWADLGML